MWKKNQIQSTSKVTFKTDLKVRSDDRLFKLTRKIDLKLAKSRVTSKKDLKVTWMTYLQID